MIKTLLATYFDVARHYRRTGSARQRRRRRNEVADGAGQADARRRGVDGLTDNFQTWLGATPDTNGMVDVIRSTLRILTETGALPGDPLPDQDPYRIINSQFVGATFAATATGMQRGAAAATRHRISTSRSSPTTNGRDCAKSAR